MTTERRSWVRLDGLSDGQLAILREEADDWLVTKADDLPKGVDDADGSRREVEEVAALGRLVSGLRRGELLMPDRIVMELTARITGETRHLDELREEYDRELAEHGSWMALLAHLGVAAAGDHEDPDTWSGSPDDEGPVCEPGGGETWNQPERGTRVKLDGRLSDDQLRIVRKAVTGLLIGRADDLRLLATHPDPEREVGEVAALGRLAFWLGRGKVLMPDRIAQEVVVRLAESSDELNRQEEIRERYERGISEHDALLALAAALSDAPPASAGPGGGGRR